MMLEGVESSVFILMMRRRFGEMAVGHPAQSQNFLQKSGTVECRHCEQKWLNKWF
jgi:hypothetical protein